MPLITIFSTPKPFTDPHIATIQRNAIKSWISLGEEVDVMLIGDEPGIKEISQELAITWFPDVKRNALGTPLINSIFQLAKQNTQTPYLVFVNADIILTTDLVQAIHNIELSLSQKNSLSSRFDASNFLLIGQRWDLDVTHLLDFSREWERDLRQTAYKNGNLHPPAGSDYFAFKRQAFDEIPPFAIGRAGWDNWMIYHAMHSNWPVIDGTDSIFIVHQNHGYSHLPNSLPHYDQEESIENMQMAGGMKYMYMILDAPFVLKGAHVVNAPLTPIRLIRRLERFLLPPATRPKGWKWALARKIRHLRRRLAQ